MIESIEDNLETTLRDILYYSFRRTFSSRVYDEILSRVYDELDFNRGIYITVKQHLYQDTGKMYDF